MARDLFRVFLFDLLISALPVTLNWLQVAPVRIVVMSKEDANIINPGVS